MPTDPTPADIEAARDLCHRIDGDCPYCGADRADIADALATARAEADAAGYARGREDGLREAANLVSGWHIKRGGYSVLAEEIRALAAPPDPWRAALPPQVYAPEPTPGPRVPLTSCAAGSDGDCYHPECPQIRDGETERAHRHCPLDTRGDDDV